MKAQIDPKPVLDDDELYLGDNGRCYCGKCSGMTARFTGRDISGQKVHRATMADKVWFWKEVGEPMTCESCGRG